MCVYVRMCAGMRACVCVCIVCEDSTQDSAPCNCAQKHILLVVYAHATEVSV